MMSRENPSTSQRSGSLDSADTTIVQELRADGRATLATLSTATGLSVSAVQSRVQRLERRGVITGYRAVVDMDALGFPISAFVSVTPVDYSVEGEIPERLRGLPGVVSCYSVAGAPSYVMVVRTESPSALEDLLNLIHTTVPVATETTMILRAYYEDDPLPGQSVE